MDAINAVHSYFKQHFNGDPIILGASGRANMIGEHTDYNEGYVFPFAIAQKIYFAAAESNDGSFHVHSLDFNDQYYESKSYEKGSWQFFFSQCVDTLESRFGRLKPLNICFGGDLPIGAGISSSSSLCCAMVELFSHFNGLPLSTLDKVNIASAIEVGSGVKGGKMDQYSIFFGQDHASLLLDCRSLTHTEVTVPDDWSFFLIHSGVKHNLVHTDYNLRREQCESVVEKLRPDFPHLRSLRDVNLDMLLEFDHLFTPTEMKRASFVLEENNRVFAFRDAIDQKNITLAGKLLNDSHNGLSHKFEVSCDELDHVHILGNNTNMLAGNRMMGGGFGGCTINLCSADLDVEAFLPQILEDYSKKWGIAARYIPIKACKGLVYY